MEINAPSTIGGTNRTPQAPSGGQGTDATGAGARAASYEPAVRVAAPEGKTPAELRREQARAEAERKARATAQDDPPLKKARTEAAEPPRRDAFGLTDDQRRIIAEMAARDQEVRRHERVHETVGGPYAGRATFVLQTGPDGRGYAVAGEVPIDVAPIKGDPQATIAKMRVVKAAALAPSDPSPADRRVAAIADANAAAAMLEIRRSQTEVDAPGKNGASVLEWLRQLYDAVSDPGEARVSVLA